VDALLRARLAEVVGAGGLSADADADAVSPGTTEEVAAVCRACAATGTRISVVSGAPAGPRRAGTGLTLALGRLDGLRVDRGAMVVRAGAGVTPEALRAAAGTAGTALVGVPLPGGLATHAGSLVARGQVPRRALTGIVAVLPTGEVVRAGGGVLKDVTGYDLAGVLLGSMGRLAVVTELGFRLQPLGARTPDAEAPPGASGAVSDVLRRAFDPGGLLDAGRPPASPDRRGDGERPR
jgi:glycolate dehydrogenase FAD-linked subunit